MGSTFLGHSYSRRRTLRAAWPLVAAFLFGGSGAFATTVEPPTFDELVNQSDFVVRAVVKSVVAESRLTPSGSRTIFSKVELEVKEVVAGTAPATVVLDVLGGTFEGRELAIEGAPKFTPGDDGIFFVQGNTKQIYPLVRMMFGLYPVMKDGRTGQEYMIRSDGEPLVDVKQVSREMPSSSTSAELSAQIARAMTPADFVTKIRATAHEAHLLEHHLL
ncbi:MAG: hypothetical protein JWM35_768 [Verrucomicrobia bacterium]|nr:hypothetical protein [Verrucomicrobiota bacterium]